MVKQWVKDLRSALARWISPPSETIGSESLEREIILTISEKLSPEDAFRLVLQINSEKGTVETDVCTSNYVEVPIQCGTVH